MVQSSLQSVARAAQRSEPGPHDSNGVLMIARAHPKKAAYTSTPVSRSPSLTVPLPRHAHSVDLRSIPHYEPPAPTQPEPFRLATEQRGEQYRATLAQRRAAEEEAARRARIPRATGLPLSTDMPLVPPRPEPRSLTVPEPFGLASEVRGSAVGDSALQALRSAVSLHTV